MSSAAGPHSSLDRIRDALDSQGYQIRADRGGRFMALCPAHPERTPSLSVQWTQGQRGGMVLLNCYGCRAQAADIVAALGLTMADLFDEPLPPRSADSYTPRAGRSAQQRRAGQRRGKLGRLPAPLTGRPAVEADAEHRWEVIETYPYVDAGARLVQEVVREECTACGARHKQFRQVFLTGTGQRVKRKPAGFAPVLYRLPAVLDAVRHGRPVWLLEGEKDVHTAERLGLVATTNTQGGGSFPAELAEVFRGAEVPVVLDRDEAGWSRGVALHRDLGAAGARVRLLLPATTVSKSDFTDHIEAGHQVDQLIPVHVDEVAARATLAAARKKHVGVEQALAETQAHVAAVEEARQQKNHELIEEHTRHARRWAVESEIRFEALRELVDDIGRCVVRSATEWAVDALDSAKEALRQGKIAARAAHEVVGIAVPPVLQTDKPAAEDPRPPRTDTAERAQQDPGGPAGGAPSWTKHPVGEVRSGVRIEQPQYRIINGQIVHLEYSTARDPDGPGEEKLKQVLALDVRIVEMEYLEASDTLDVDSPTLYGRDARLAQQALNPPGPAELAAVVVAYTHPATGEGMQMRIPADVYKDCTWLESLPGPPSYSSKPTELARLRDAIKAVSGEIRVTTRYRSTGWRRDEAGQWMYVHAGGAITATGPKAVPVLLSGPLARYDLPDPSVDPKQLRAAFVEHSAGMLTKIPGRVAAPLLGHVYRSAMGPNPWVLALIGSPGSYKTSIASLAMQHWGELWDRRKPASSMSGNGDTLNALRIKLNSAKDSLYWADDVAPTRDWGAAQKMLEEFARLVHNGEQRSRSTRDGLGVLDGTPPRSSALVTSEVMPRPGSGAQRMLIVPLQASEVELEHLIALDADESRHGRALLMSSMLRWLAGGLAETRARCLAEAARYAEGLRADGETVRQAEAFGHTWAGWMAMTEFLVEVGAISDAERHQVLNRVDTGLRDAAAATADPDLPSRTGARIRELVAHALRSGLAYVDDVRTGDAPPWPLAGRLGHRRAIIGVDELGQPKYRVEARGIRFGYVLHDPMPKEGVPQLLVESTAIEQVLKAASMTMADAMQVDRGTAIRSLYDEGVLIAEERTGRTPRYTVQRTLHCEDGRRQRMTALRLRELLGDAPDEDATPLGGPEPVTPTGDSDATTPDLFAPPPADNSQQAESGAQAPDPGPTSPQRQEEDSVRSYTDTEGTTGAAELIAFTEPCLMCGQHAGVRILGHILHIPCWEGSTAASRAAAAANRHDDNQPAAAVRTGIEPAARTGIEPAAAPASTRTPRRSRTAVSRFTAPAAVLHTDGIWLHDGTRIDVPRPLRHVGHIAALVEQLNLGTKVTNWRDEPGQIWVTADMLSRLGIDVEQIPADPTRRVEAMRGLTRGSELVTAAIADGWQIGGAGDCLGAWTRVWHGEARGVWIALIPAMNHDPLDLPVLGDQPQPATVARRMALFAGALRAPWAMSAATTGLDLMISLRARDKDRLFTPRQPVPPAQVSTLEQDLNWSRTPTQEERRQPYVHAYDRGGSYAAGIAGLELGIGEAEHHPHGRPFDPKLPGYWKFEVPEAGDWRYPHPLNPRGGIPARAVWATTPGVQLAYELGYDVPILETYTWPEHARILDPWYERIRDARTSLDTADPDAQAARDLLKVVYTRTIGMLGSDEWMRNRAGYAPDRRHHIVAKARSNILRRILQIGRDADRWPVAVTADTVVYVSDDPNPLTGWPGKPEQYGRGFGQFKAEASGLLVDQLPYLTGKGYRGKEKLDHDWNTGDGSAEQEAAS